MPRRRPRGVGLTALFAVGTGLAQQASAGCLDVPGVKIPASYLQNSQSPFGSARFMNADFRQGSQGRALHRGRISDESRNRTTRPSFFHAPDRRSVGLQIHLQGQCGARHSRRRADRRQAIPHGLPTVMKSPSRESAIPLSARPVSACGNKPANATYVLNHIGLSWNPLAPSAAPAGPGNPGGGPGASSGPAFIKQYVTLSKDRPELHGTFAINQLMPDGKTPALPAPIKGIITATRVTIDTDTQEP